MSSSYHYAEDWRLRVKAGNQFLTALSASEYSQALVLKLIIILLYIPILNFEMM